MLNFENRRDPRSNLSINPNACRVPLIPILRSESDQADYSQSFTLPLSEISRELATIIGKKLTAYIGHAKDTRTVDCWISGGEADEDAEQRLRFAYHVVKIVREQESPKVVQAWLIGMNPELDDRVMIRMLREEPLDTAVPFILGAARAFAACV